MRLACQLRWGDFWLGCEVSVLVAADAQSVCRLPAMPAMPAARIHSSNPQEPMPVQQPNCPPARHFLPGSSFFFVPRPSLSFSSSPLPDKLLDPSIISINHPIQHLQPHRPAPPRTTNLQYVKSSASGHHHSRLLALLQSSTLLPGSISTRPSGQRASPV